MLVRIVRQMRDRGLGNFLAYSFYRFDDAYRLGRFGIASAMKSTMVYRSRDQLGLTELECHGHNPTESYRVFRTLMRRFVNPTESDVFLDYGSGIGRVLLMASTYPFRKIIGVEYSQELNGIAAGIIERVKNKLLCRNIQLISMDASEYELPSDVTVIYFFNPFEGEILSKVVERIRRSFVQSPRRIVIVYHLPSQFEKAIAGCGWLAKRAEVVFPAVTKHKFSIYETTASASPAARMDTQ